MAAGTIPISMTQQLDIYGQPLAGGQLYIIQAGTVSTPQDAFQDVALTIKQPYPMTLDAAGRVPQFFLDNTTNATVKIRLQDKNGVVQLAADNVLVIGPSGGTGGGGTTVDPTALIQTGNMIMRYGVGVLTGYVRMNGLTIGSTTSSASMPEGARPEVQNLFMYLWNTDPTLQVYAGTTPSRGTSASLDWTNNKNIATPDWRGYAPAGLCDMGNSQSANLTAGFWGGNPIQLGAVGGGESVTLTATQIPAISSSGSNTISVGPSRNIPSTAGGISAQPSPSTGGNSVPYAPSADWSTAASYSGTNTINVGSTNTGGAAHRTIGPRKLCTFYLKL